MKQIFLYLGTSIAMLSFFAGCKKSENSNTLTVSSFATNEALVESKAKIYFIADVEGIEGIAKINEQDTRGCVSAGYGGGSCSNGSCHYSGDVGCYYTGKNWNLGVDYYGMGETRENLITSEVTTLKSPKGESYGVRIIYTAPKGKTYYSNVIYNANYEWANIELKEMTPSGGTPPYYIKLRFNCELKELSGTGVIRLKNAIVRVKI